MIMLKKKKQQLHCFELIIAFSSLFLLALVSANHHGNTANDLVDIINKNRTSQKLPQLNNSPGLGCMALQYIKQCQGNCTSDNTLNCHPSEDDFTQVFAPNCGVELPTFGTISGNIAGCHHKHLNPSDAFSRVLVLNNKTLSLVRNKTHTEVGVGLIRSHKGNYWCVLFSSSQTNSSFVLEDLGKGIQQKTGCFSGTSVPCSRAVRRSNNLGLEKIFIVWFLFIYWLQMS